MTQKFKVGDRGTWNSEAGFVSGTIRKIHTKNVETVSAIHRSHGMGPPR